MDLVGGLIVLANSDFTYNPDNRNCYWLPTVTEIKDNFSNSNKLSIYPNPTLNWINISINDINKIESIEVFSPDGILVSKHLGSIDKLNLEKLDTGLYIIRVKLSTRYYTKKIIKH